MAVRYTRAAARDLEEIANYTRETWGERQCGVYLDALEQACERFLPENVAVTSLVAGRPGFRRWRCWHHVIYFRVVKGTLEVVRVLHERMVPDKHL